MRRQAFWLGFGALALAALGGLWFITHFERVPVTEREPPQAAARRNPYLALERLLARYGRAPQTVSETTALDGLTPGGVLILDSGRRQLMSEARVERLLAWVAAGGYLLVDAERMGVDDPVLERLGVRRKEAPALECGAGGAAVRPPETAEVRLPGDARALRLASAGHGLESEDAPTWQAALPGGGAAVMHFDTGSGRVTAFADFARLADNDGIGEHDHAELILELLRRHQPEGQVRLATRLALPTLADWLLDQGSMLLVSAALLLGAWLWRIVPRFGPFEPERAPERRGLAEHLAAVGRCVWRSGGLDHWLAAVRQGLQARIARRHPGIAAATAGEQAGALAKLAGLTAAQVRFAFWGRAATPKDYAEAVRLLQRIERAL